MYGAWVGKLQHPVPSSPFQTNAAIGYFDAVFKFIDSNSAAVGQHVKTGRREDTRRTSWVRSVYPDHTPTCCRRTHPQN